MGVTAVLSEFTAGIRLDALPPEVVNRARFLVLDLVGNIVRARHDAESTASFLAATRAMGMASGNAGVFGDAARYTPAGAAFLNGALAHSLDFDDTHAAGSLHPGAPVIPAALAAGDFLTALDLLRHAPDDPDFRRRTERDYLLVLALARAGAARSGLECFRERLANAPLESLPPDMARDIAALEARDRLGRSFSVAMVCHFNYSEATEYRDKGELSDAESYQEVLDYENRVLSEVELWEVSLVTFPMLPGARLRVVGAA